MKKKKAKRKPATIGTPEEQRTEEETIMHYNAVLMEHLDSKYNLLLELVKPIPVILERLDKLDLRFDEVDGRLSTLELAFRGLKDDMLDMEHRLSSKINRITERCEKHECRLNALEANQ